MKKILPLIAIIVFWLGAYYMGNIVLDTFDEPFLFKQISSTLYGVLLWGVVGAVCIITFIVYYGLSQLLEH